MRYRTRSVGASAARSCAALRLLLVCVLAQIVNSDARAFTDSRVKSRCPVSEVIRTGEDGDGVVAAIGIGEDPRLIAYAIKRAGLGGY